MTAEPKIRKTSEHAIAISFPLIQSFQDPFQVKLKFFPIGLSEMESSCRRKEQMKNFGL
jgi:predicted class III extradiol MEMO1 family dioxygenase